MEWRACCSPAVELEILQSRPDPAASTYTLYTVMSTDSEDRLFVYGTLMQPVGNDRHQRLEQNARYLGRALFQGKLFLVDDYPGAIPSPEPSHRVTGELYYLDNPATVFRELDRYEGYVPANPERSLYLRERRQVKLEDREEPIYAWIYIFNRPTGNLRPISSGDYLQYLQEERE